MASGQFARALLTGVRSFTNVADQKIKQKGTSSLSCKNTRCMSLAATARQLVVNESYFPEIPISSISVTRDCYSQDGIGKKVLPTDVNLTENLFSRIFSPRARAQKHSVLALRRYPWASNHQLKEFDYESMKKNDRILLDWLLTMETKGCAMLRNVPKKEVAGPEMIEHIAFVKQSRFGHYSPLSSRSQENNVTLTDSKLGMHGDFLQFEPLPGIIFIHCMEKQTGESFIADGLYAGEILRKEQPKAFEFLSNSDPYFWGKGHTSYDWGLKDFHQIAGVPMINVDNKQQVTQTVVNNVIRDSYNDLPAETVKHFYSAMKLFNDILYDNSVVFRIDSGDMMTFDNVRCHYGNEECEKFCRKHIEFSYLDWDDAHDRRRTIQEKPGSLVIK